MLNIKALVTAACAAGLLLFFYCFLHKKKREERFNAGAHPLLQVDLATDPAVESITGHPDYDLRDESGALVVRQGDITLSPGFMAGSGELGFGRYGSSFMA